jgi:hypothetical protein
MAVASEKSIFFQALDIESPDERSAYVQQACAGDDDLLASVCALLRENEREENPVDRPIAAGFLPTLITGGDDDTDSRFTPGTMVGPYKLMERIGEGGFGWVFVAEQQSPVRRRVALKIIKPGMESREVIARFEAERQAIALMDHPNIARVFDASVEQSKGSPSVPWIDWVEFLINHREASIVVNGHKPAVDPRFRQVQSDADATIAD